MIELAQFVILGLGAGAAYALLAQGVVLVYRGSGVVNFAQGGLAMVAAYACFLELQEERGWPLWAALATSVVLSAAVAGAFDILVLARLAGAAPLVRVIATLGLLVVVQAGAQHRWGTAFERVDGFLPDGTYHWGDLVIQQDRLILLGIAGAVTVMLTVAMRSTLIGLAITASASNEQAVAALGWSPRVLSAITWSVGGGLAGLAGILVAPLTGLTPSTFTVVVTVSALAAALLGGFRSFPLTLAGGLVLGIGESVTTLYQDDIRSALGLEVLTGANRAVPFLVILAVMVVRGQGLPLRGHLADRLPRLGTGSINPVRLVPAVLAAGALLAAADASWSASLSLTLTAAVMVLSVVVLTGLAGQLSLAQYSVGGIGALFAARLVAESGWPVELAIPAAVLMTVPVGLVFALPALRTRGVNLAVVTLGMGFTIQEVIFANPTLTGTALQGGSQIGGVSIFGVDVSSIEHPQRWSFVCLAAFVLAAVAVANLRRSSTGRRLVAVRTNERAAASLGIEVLAVKLYAFGFAAALAALGGILLGFRNPTVTFGSFNVFASIQLIGQAVIGGVGYVVGAIFGAPMAAGAVGGKIMDAILELGSWEELASGVLLIGLVLLHPDGISDVVSHLRHRRATPHDAAPAEPAPLPATKVAPRALRVQGLSVHFGGVVALDDVDLEIEPGEVVGLIGPNGAGKSTFIDAVTGFASPRSGSVFFGDDCIDSWRPARRAQTGLRRSFQSLELFEDMSVAQNLHAGTDEARWWTWLTDLVRPGRPRLPDAASVAVAEFGLAGVLSANPLELPYGQRRLVGIARAVAAGPSVVLLDEPAAGLDAAERDELGDLVRRLSSERGMGVLLVEHDVPLVLSTCDRVVVLQFGRCIASGTPEQIQADPAVRAAYLGEPAEVSGG